MNVEQTHPIRKKYKKHSIPNALRQQVWLKHCGEVFKRKCSTTWCNNFITVYNFHCGHNIPEIRGGATTIENLIPICTQCNLSMGHQFTFDEWCRNFKPRGENTVTAIVSNLSPTVPEVSIGQNGFCCK